MTKEGSKRWTVDTLLIHINRIFKERDKRYEEKFIARAEAVKIAMEATDKALSLAADAAERRFASVNEFRQALEDQTQTYMLRAEYVVQHKALEKELQGHILNEFDKNATQEEKQDGKLTVIKEKLDAVNKWLLGLMGAVVVALVLTIVDLLVRGLSK